MKRVTKILSRIFPMSSAIPKEVLENAQKRGTAVHKWIEQYNDYLLNGGEYPVIDMEYLIYADYYKKWVEDYKVVPIHTELTLSDKDEGMCGTLDMICKTKDDDIIVVDFKITYQPNIPYVELQTSAYKHMAVVNKFVGADTPQALLHISKTGYQYIRLNDEWEKFKAVKDLDDYIDRRSKQ